jgi:hypothetical protein
VSATTIICDRVGCDEPATIEIMRWHDGIRTCPVHYSEALRLGGACMIGPPRTHPLTDGADDDREENP